MVHVKFKWGDVNQFPNIYFNCCMDFKLQNIFRTFEQMMEYMMNIIW